MPIAAQILICVLKLPNGISLNNALISDTIAFHLPQVSVHVAKTHQTSQHQTRKQQIHMVGPYAILAINIVFVIRLRPHTFYCSVDQLNIKGPNNMLLKRTLLCLCPIETNLEAPEVLPVKTKTKADKKLTLVMYITCAVRLLIKGPQRHLAAVSGGQPALPEA